MAGTAHIRFYAELNDFLPPPRRGKSLDYPLVGSPSVKDAVECLGVPHTEVELLLLDGRSVDFSARLKSGARLSVFPVFESLDIFPVVRARAAPLRRLRFLLDTHLAGLARMLRMLGLDAELPEEGGDRALADAASSGWYLLTRDRALLMRRAVTHGYYVRGEHPQEQVEEVVRRFDLFGSLQPFTRCLVCNLRLDSVTPEEILGRIPDPIRRRYSEFRSCPQCQRVYWRGSHQKGMERIIASLGI